jgi:hypothetical protein
MVGGGDHSAISDEGRRQARDEALHKLHFAGRERVLQHDHGGGRCLARAQPAQGGQGWLGTALPRERCGRPVARWI